jgi:hypothetical protein
MIIYNIKRFILFLQKVFYGEASESLKDRSYIPARHSNILTHPDPQQLVLEFAGLGVSNSTISPGESGYRELVNFKEIIGYTVNEETKEKTITTFGKIQYLKNGVYIVPATPAEQYIKKYDLKSFLLSMQRALSTCVIPSLRAVTLKFEPETQSAVASFFFDQEITNDLFETASCVYTESSADFALSHENFSFKALALPPPLPCPIEGHLVYHRYETNFVYPLRQDLLVPFIHEEFYIRLVMQQALLGLVTPALRGVFIDKQCSWLGATYIWFIYDGEITPFSRSFAKKIVMNAKTFFPNNYEIIERIQRIDSPNRYDDIPLTENAWIVFSREE